MVFQGTSKDSNMKKPESFHIATVIPHADFIDLFETYRQQGLRLLIPVRGLERPQKCYPSIFNVGDFTSTNHWFGSNSNRSSEFSKRGSVRLLESLRSTLWNQTAGGASADGVASLFKITCKNSTPSPEWLTSTTEPKNKKNKKKEGWLEVQQLSCHVRKM